MTTDYVSNLPPVKGSAYTRYLFLTSQADTKLAQTSVTLAAGDVIVYKDGVLDGNIDTLPTEIGTTGILAVALSATEMNANHVTVKFRDVAGAQWCDLQLDIDTVTAVTVSDGTNVTVSAASVTAIQSGLATGANQTTILANLTTIINRIGAFTGTGVNTILGFLKALASKTAALPSDIGGTYAATTDSLEALSDKLAVAAPLVPSVSSGEITQYRGDAWSIGITGLGVITGYTTLDFTIKQYEKDADTAAILRVRKNASGLSDGLMRVNGAAPSASTDASITINDAAAGDITVTVIPSVTDDLNGSGLFYDVQKIVGTSTTTMRKNVFNVVSDITRAIA